MKHLTFAWLLAAGWAIVAPASADPARAQFSQDSRVDSTFRLRLSTQQLQQILARVRTDADALRRALDPSIPRGGAYGDSAAHSQNPDIQYAIDDLLAATDHFEDHQSRRTETRFDLEDVMRRGTSLDQTFSNGRYTLAQRNAWQRVRGDLDALAAAYGSPWSWSNPQYGSGSDLGYRRFSGTYALDNAQSDDPQRVADQALRGASAAARSRLASQLAIRLTPPEELALERVDDQFTLASSRGPRLTFDANGQARSESGFGSESVTTRASVYGDRLEVTTTGADTDYTVVFEPLENGQRLQVTREIFDPSLRQPVTARSVYRRTSNTPDWTIADRGSRVDDFGQLEGQTLVATLDAPLNVRTAREGQRVTLTVHDQGSAFDNATIEGFVLGSPTDSGGRTGRSFEFNQIRLRNGRTSSFDGRIEGVRRPDGREVAFDPNEEVRDDGQTEEAVRRGAIGAAIGAILGAVIGGGKGAAIGAAVGAGGGAGTVFIEGRDLALPQGTEFTIRSYPPNRRF